ncbi:MAG TPA: AI-2E family transporter [Fimbriimonas sp.]|nr:AI-2E family transporter [Fimbriimonas sp.]
MQDWRKGYRGLLLAGLVVGLLFIGAQMLLPFVPALLWATVLSILTYPLFERLTTRLSQTRYLQGGRSESAASLLVTLGTLIVICIPFVIIGVGLFLQIGGVTRELDGGLSLDSVLAKVDETIKPLATQLGAQTFSFSDYVQEHRADIVSTLKQPVQRFAGQAGLTILTLVFALLTQFFMLRDGRKLIQPVVELSPLSAEKTNEIRQKVIATVKAVFTGTVLVALLQGAIIGITYALVGVPNALLLGVVSAILCIIPLLGAPVIYIPVALWLISQGQVTQGAIILGVGFVIVSQIDNVVKPFLIGGQVNLHPMAIFFSILGGIVVFGPIGVMAGPMLLTILIALQDVIREARIVEDGLPPETT